MTTVEIRPPSLRAETLNVLKASGAVIMLVAAYLLRPALFGGTDARESRSADLLPFQRLVADAPSGDQRMFRELQEGLLEAERVRATTGQWPDSRTFATDGIPPFAPDPTRKEATYRWSTLVQGSIVNYVGVPTTASASAWLLVIIEPEAGAPPDPAPNDETHHRLPDGTTLHVSIWQVPEKIRKSGFSASQLPQNEGWTQLLVGTYGR